MFKTVFRDSVMKKFIQLLFIALMLVPQGCKSPETEKGPDGDIIRRLESDLCVYGASGAGIAAAVAAAREGNSVIILEPAHKIGGLLGSGFRMQQDVPYADHLGGLTGAFYAKDIAQPQPRHQQEQVLNINSLQVIDEYKSLSGHYKSSSRFSKTSDGEQRSPF
jgi:hypothetical protein